MTVEKIKGRGRKRLRPHIAEGGGVVLRLSGGGESGTINTRDAVDVKKKAELRELGPKDPNRELALASHFFGVATNPDAVVLVGIVKPTSIPLSLTPFTKVTPTPLGSSTEEYVEVLLSYTKPCEAPAESW
jgi:hypothetical protein